MRKEILKYFVLCFLAFVGSNVWIFDTNFIVLIPLFAYYVNIGRSESIIFAIMSIIATLIYGEIYSLLLILSYIMFLVIYKIIGIVFVNGIDSCSIASFISVFMLCIEKKYNSVDLYYSLICLGFSLISFWLFYAFTSLDNIIEDYFIEKKYKLDIKIYQSSLDKDYCGDCFDYFSYGSKKYLLLSDGMYVGKSAYKLSSNVLFSLRNLVEAGNDVEDVVNVCSKIINSKYGCEEFSTLDLIELDHNKLKLIKRGAEDSFLIRNKEAIKIKGDSLPLGVDGECNKKILRIREDDVLVMFSDGVKEKYPLFESMIENKIYGDNLYGWMKKIMDRNCINQKDDFSIILIKFVDIS